MAPKGGSSSGGGGAKKNMKRGGNKHGAKKKSGGASAGSSGHDGRKGSIGTGGSKKPNLKKKSKLVVTFDPEKRTYVTRLCVSVYALYHYVLTMLLSIGVMQ